ncbi:MAG: DUF368 domain-containing protein [Bacillota bacterium]
MVEDKASPSGSAPGSFLVGLAMGLTSVVPGLSAGTVAVVLGVYPRLLESIGQLKYLRLIPLALGWAGGAIAAIQTVGWGFESMPGETRAFLMGIVLASAVNISRRYPPKGIGFPIAAAAFAAVWWLVPISGAAGPSMVPLKAWELIGSGAASGGAMILPGFSGGTVLVLLGVYSRVIGVAASWDWLGILLFVLGALGGMYITASLMWRAYESKENLVYAFLAGLTAGSVRVLFPDSVSVSIVLAGLLGFLLAALLGGVSDRKSGEGMVR